MSGLTKEFTEAELLKREKEIEQRIEKAKQTREEFDEARYELFHPQLGVKTLLDGGRRRTKNLYGVFKRTVPAGQVRQ